MNELIIISIAGMGILLFGLGANVTRHRATRGADGEQAPTDPSDALLVAIRAHGNAAEYVPTLAVAALVARLLHGLGMLASGSLAKRSPVKEAGAMLTYLVGLALGVTALVGL